MLHPFLWPRTVDNMGVKERSSREEEDCLCVFLSPLCPPDLPNFLSLHCAVLTCVAGLSCTNVKVFYEAKTFKFAI